MAPCGHCCDMHGPVLWTLKLFAYFTKYILWWWWKVPCCRMTAFDTPAYVGILFHHRLVTNLLIIPSPNDFLASWRLLSVMVYAILFLGAWLYKHLNVRCLITSPQF
jgi:hypothetical protein